ncbi:SpaA isopeptide-forming pilin-related protein [Arcanobacterium hippocoleae]
MKENQNGELVVADFAGAGVQQIPSEACKGEPGRALHCVDLTNKRSPELRLKKIDADNPDIALAGVSFTLLKKDISGDYLPYLQGDNKIFITRQDGTLNFPFLAEGEYRLTETKPIPGYANLTKPIDFRVAKNAQIEVTTANQNYNNGILTIKNQKQSVPLEFNFQKIMSSNTQGNTCNNTFGVPVSDECKILVGNLKMQITAKNGGKQVAQTWDLANDWKEKALGGKQESVLEFKLPAGLADGEYILREIEAPAGFLATEEEWTLRIDNTARTVSWVKSPQETVLLFKDGADAKNSVPLIVKNPLIEYPALPLTGSFGVAPFAAAAGLLMCLALIMYLRRNAKSARYAGGDLLLT